MIKPVSFKAYFVNNENLRELYYRNNNPNTFNVGYFKNSCPNHKLEIVGVSGADADGSRFINVYNHDTDRFIPLMTDGENDLDDVLQSLNIKHMKNDEFWQKKSPRKNILKLLTSKK